MSDIAPIVPNLPNSTRAVANKYGSPTSPYAPGPSGQALLTALNNLPQRATTSTSQRPATQANTINPLALYDLARANRGMPPLTARQSALALRTLSTGTPATPPRRQSIPKAAINDLRAMVGGIFHLPQALYHEAQQLPQLPSLAAKTLASSDNPINAFGNLAALPGLRMIPGSYVARELASDEGQGLEGLAAHPLFTALDLLPVASGAAKFTKVSSAADAAYMAQANALSKAQVAEGLPAAATILPREAPALKTVLTRRLTPDGEVIPNRFGTFLNNAGEDFKATNAGGFLTQMFKERDTSRITEGYAVHLGEAMDPRLSTEALQYPGYGGNAAMAEEHALRDVTMDVVKQQHDIGAKPLSAEAERIHNAVTGVKAYEDGTPISPEFDLTLSESERAMARTVREAQYQFSVYTDALPGKEGTISPLVRGTRETYDYRHGQQLQRIRTAAEQAQELHSLRQTILDPASSSRVPAELQAGLDALRANGRDGLNKAARGQLESLYTHALDALGKPANMDPLISVLRPLARIRPTVHTIISDLKRADWQAAKEGLEGFSKTKKGQELPVDFQGVITELQRLRDRDKALVSTSHITDRYVAKRVKLASKAELSRPAPRFQPILESAARERITGHVREVFSTHPDLDKFVKLADAGIYDTLKAADPILQKIIRDDMKAVNEGWLALREAGHDPIFVSRVTPSEAARQPFPRISDKPMSLKQVKARGLDAAPYVKDVTIALKQQSLDILTRRATEDAMRQIGTNYGVTRADLVAMYTDRLLATQQDSTIPMKARLAKMMKAGWAEYKPGDFGGAPTAAFSVERGTDIFIPRAMAENLRRMYTPRDSGLTAMIDKPMNMFRTSVLPLALRWQLNNVVSNVVIAAVSDPRALLEFPSVFKMMRQERKEMPAAGGRVKQLGEPPAGIGSQPPDTRRWAAEVHANSPYRDRVTAVAQYASGSTARRLLETARSDRISKIADFGRRKIQQSYDYNQFFDDVARGSMSRVKMRTYLGKGYSHEAAQAMTASSIRRTFQAWDEMTPMERSVIRSIMPFYGFAAYATRFVLHYPFDHPLRVSVLNSLTRAEMEDNLTGLPQQIRDMILLGDPRANGVVKALNVSPFNPFGGVPSMFTIQGFIGQTSPIITGLLESIGVDVQRGGPQLYPEMQYDPETGKLIARPGNPITSIAGNLIPQVAGITSLFGWNDQFNSTLARDPAAAGRMLMSNFGLPILYKDINVGDQLIKSEMARAEDQELARKRALKEGKLSILDDFPGLAAYGEQIRALEAAGQLDALRPVAGQPGAPSKVGIAYATQAALAG